MPEELEILRINIILPEDSEDILALAPKDIDINKKDKVKRWIEKSFKNLDRLKLNLGGELDAEGFFGMEQQGDNHPEKVLLCIYSKDKVKLSSFIAVLGNICFRPSTSKKGHIPFFGEWVNEKNWKSKVTLHGGYFKHIEMVRFRKILRKRRAFSQCMQSRHESQPIINYNLLKYYKPYIVDRHGRSKPELKSFCRPNSNIAQNNATETMNSKRKLHRTIKKKDLINPILMNSISKLNPLVCEQTINKLKPNNSKQDSFENVNQRFLCVFDNTRKRKSYENQSEIKRNRHCTKQCLLYAAPTKNGEKFNNFSDENDTSLTNYKEINSQKYKKCSNPYSSCKSCKENIKCICDLKAGKMYGSKDDNCQARNTLKETKEGKYKIYLSKSPSTKSVHEEITNCKEKSKIIRGSFKNLHAVSNLKSNKSIGIQVPSQFSLKGITNEGFGEHFKQTNKKHNRLGCNKCKIDEECSVKSIKVISVHVGEERKLKNKERKHGQMMTDNVRYQKIKNWKECLSVDEVNRCKKQGRSQTNCKKLYCCFKCMGRRQNRKRLTSSFTRRHEKKLSVDYNSYSDEEKGYPKHSKKVSKDKREYFKQSLSEEYHKKQGIFRKLFARNIKLKKDKSLRYCGKIYMEDESEYEVAEPEIRNDGIRAGRTKVGKYQRFDQNSKSSFGEVSQTINFKNDGFCDYCGHSNRVRPIRCRHVIDSLDYMKNIKESKYHNIKDSLCCVKETKNKISDEVQETDITENYSEHLELRSIQRKNTKSNNRKCNLNCSKEFVRLGNGNQLTTEQEAYNLINVHERNNIMFSAYRTKTDFDANAKMYSKNVFNVRELSKMTEDWSKSNKCALIKNKRKDILRNKCKRELEIIDNESNLFKKVKEISRNKKSNGCGNFDKESNLERKQLSSVLDIVKIKAKALHLEHVSRKLKDYYNYRTTNSEFEKELVRVSVNKSNLSNTRAESFTGVATDIDKSHNINIISKLENNTKEAVNFIPAMATEDTLQGNTRNYMNKGTNKKYIIFKTLNEAQNTLTSKEEIIESQMPSNKNNCVIKNQEKSIKSSNSDKLQEEGKCLKKFVSKDKAELSLVEKSVVRRKARTKSQVRRKTKELALKQKPIWSSDETITLKLKDKRLFSA